MASKLTVPQLIEAHNAVAKKLGRPAIKSWKKAKHLLASHVEVMEREAAEPQQTIRAYALQLLCGVTHHEDRSKAPGPNNSVSSDHKNARSVGVPYDEIIRRIKERFPECDTTVACLRWYAVKVRAEEKHYEGLRLPQRRPRVGSKA